MSEIIKAIQGADSIAIIAHISPDGDTLGSSFALCEALRALGKTAFVLCEGAPQTELKYLPFFQELYTAPPAPFAIAIAVDCSDDLRLGEMAQYFLQAKTSIVIDHHKSNNGFGDLCFVDSLACATGEIMYDVIDALGVNFTPSMAQCLYTAMATDTGNFSYSNTTPTALAYVATLLSVGFDLAALNDVLFRSRTLAKTRLMGLCIQKMQLVEQNRFAYSILRTEDVAATGADSRDFDGIIDVLRDIDTVEVALLVRQNAQGDYKASLRSSFAVDVADICTRFGGGGHAKAAGASICQADIQRLIEAVLEVL